MAKILFVVFISALAPWYSYAQEDLDSADALDLADESFMEEVDADFAEADGEAPAADAAAVSEPAQEIVPLPMETSPETIVPVAEVPASVPAPEKKVKSKPAKKLKESKKAKKAKKAANKKGFFKVANADCTMYGAPEISSQALLVVKKDRKLWLEEHNGGWFKGFRKKGVGYIERSCFK